MTIGGDESFVDSFGTSELNGLIAVFPTDQVDEEGRPLYGLEERTDVPLSRVEPGTYQGSVALEPGHWAVVPFPHTIGALRVEDAYPKTVILEIGDDRRGIRALAAVGAAIAIAWRFRDAVRGQPASDPKKAELGFPRWQRL